jgi:DNA-binding transcriptional regulator YiaG
MPKTKVDTVTKTKMAIFFNVTTETLRQWEKSDDKRLNHKYAALKDYLQNIMDTEIYKHPIL